MRPRTGTKRVRMQIPQVPHSEWLQSGPQTRITTAVRGFSWRLPGTNPANDRNPQRTPEEIIQIVKAAMNELQKFRKVPVGMKKLEAHYAKRTADDIIRTKTIITAIPEVDRKGFCVHGCHDYSTALAAVLRARLIPTVFIRQLTHSQVYFFNGQKWMEADPSDAILFNPAPRVLKRFEEAIQGKKARHSALE